MFHQVECLLAVPHRAIGAIAEAIIERSVTRRRREVERCKAQAGGVAFETAAQQAGDALPPRVRGDVDIADPRPPGPGIPIHAVARPEAGDADGIAVFERDEAARERAGPLFGDPRARFIAGSAAEGTPLDRKSTRLHYSP